MIQSRFLKYSRVNARARPPAHRRESRLATLRRSRGTLTTEYLPVQHIERLRVLVRVYRLAVVGYLVDPEPPIEADPSVPGIRTKDTSQQKLVFRPEIELNIPSSAETAPDTLYAPAVLSHYIAV